VKASLKDLDVAKIHKLSVGALLAAPDFRPPRQEAFIWGAIQGRSKQRPYCAGQ